MKIYIRLIFISVLGLLAVNCFGQHKGTEKYKPPKLFTALGNAKDSSILSVKDLTALVPLELSIKDEAGNKYGISSYQFVYKRVAVTEDEKTGKAMPTTTMVSSLFRHTPLPKIWITQITQELKPGEELFFFDIFVTDNKGRILAAPDMRILAK